MGIEIVLDELDEWNIRLRTGCVEGNQFCEHFLRIQGLRRQETSPVDHFTVLKQGAKNGRVGGLAQGPCRAFTLNRVIPFPALDVARKDKRKLAPDS